MLIFNDFFERDLSFIRKFEYVNYHNAYHKNQQLQLLLRSAWRRP